MKKWEYKRVGFPNINNESFGIQDHDINALGREGWEMIGFFVENLNPPEDDYSGWETFWFKREIEATKAQP